MGYKTGEEYLWELKLSLIKTFPVFLTASLALSQIFGSREFAKNSYLLLTFGILLMFLLAVVEIIAFSKGTKGRKKRRGKRN